MGLLFLYQLFESSQNLSASPPLWYSRHTFIQAIERKKNAKVFTEKERICIARPWFWKTKEIKKTERQSNGRPVPWPINHE